MTIQLLDSAADWRAALDDARALGRSVGLVPTMGALHAGHMSLIRAAAAACDLVAVTDYVNPLQFGASEDLSKYPRDLEGDCRLAEAAGGHLVFAPTPEEMWPRPAMTSVTVDGVSAPLEGVSRPGHFAGVATIVAKLFNLAGPCTAFFGEKDFQQLAVIRRMTDDLALPVRVVGCPTVREPDGLALSSRNAYLTDAERVVAPRLYAALLAGQRAIEDDGVTDPVVVSKAMAAVVAAEPMFDLDYAEVADREELTRPDTIRGEVRLLIAARLGRARLIDNVAAVASVPD